MRYLTRQVAVDAIQWDSNEQTLQDIHSMVGPQANVVDMIDNQLLLLQVDTETGQCYAYPGDWIVWDGEYAAVCKRERFSELYAPAQDYILNPQNVQVSFTSAPLHPSQVIELISDYDIPAKGEGEAHFQSQKEMWDK